MAPKRVEWKNKVSALAAYLLISFFLPFVCCTWAGEADKITGALVDGFRVLPAAEMDNGREFVVYRGDYIKFHLDKGESPLLRIPALGIEQRLETDQGQVPYFKMKQVGVFELSIGEAAGTIRVIEYTGAHYRSVSAGEAQEVIRSFSPFILDVRTPKEYKSARLENAVLLPVQELQNRWAELLSHKDDPILIYCATGNRSTVASKILIDRGFTRIFNLRHGIVDWYRKKHPVVQGPKVTP